MQLKPLKGHKILLMVSVACLFLSLIRHTTWEIYGIKAMAQIKVYGGVLLLKQKTNSMQPNGLA